VSAVVDLLSRISSVHEGKEYLYTSSCRIGSLRETIPSVLMIPDDVESISIVTLAVNDPSIKRCSQRAC
jgi:hypothetical protein